MPGVRTAAAALASMLVLTSAATAAAPLVPAAAQRQIATRVRRLAYVPARGAIGWRYRSWAVRSGALRIVFASRSEPRKTFVFEARVFHGVCRVGMQRSFQMAGVEVWARRTAARGQAWRCVHGTKLVAWSALPERRFALVGLARVAASGHAIR